MTPQSLHRRAETYNWDDGIGGARRIALHPDCDRATALLLYWRLSPHHYRRFASVAEVPAREQSAAELVWELEAGLVAGRFATSLFSYDPADDGGVDRTKPSDEEERSAVRSIPAELFDKCGSASDADRLDRACRTGDIGAVDAAVAAGEWERLSLSGKRTLIGMAVERDHRAVAERLLAADAPVRFSRGHRTLLDDAPGVAMIDLLARHGADPVKASLALAVSKGPEVIRRLVELGVPLDGLSRWGETAVYRAAADGHVEVLCTLIELGANRDIPRTSDGRTALQAVDERLEVLRALLEGAAPYDCPERTEYGRLTSVRIALTGDRRTEDARFW